MLLTEISFISCIKMMSYLAKMATTAETNSGRAILVGPRLFFIRQYISSHKYGIIKKIELYLWILNDPINRGDSILLQSIRKALIAINATINARRVIYFKIMFFNYFKIKKTFILYTLNYLSTFLLFSVISLFYLRV